MPMYPQGSIVGGALQVSTARALSSKRLKHANFITEVDAGLDMVRLFLGVEIMSRITLMSFSN